MNSAIELHHNLCKRILRLRALARLVDTREFQDAYNALPDKSQINQLISAEDKHGVYEWVKKQNRERETTVKILRREARSLGIPNWFNLNQQSLISEIKKYETFQDSSQ
jgi:hypothetical protein